MHGWAYAGGAHGSAACAACANSDAACVGVAKLLACAGVAHAHYGQRGEAYVGDGCAEDLVNADVERGEDADDARSLLPHHVRSSGSSLRRCSKACTARLLWAQ